jgi:hypothetical protein
MAYRASGLFLLPMNPFHVSFFFFFALGVADLLTARTWTSADIESVETLCGDLLRSCGMAPIHAHADHAEEEIQVEAQYLAQRPVCPTRHCTTTLPRSPRRSSPRASRPSGRRRCCNRAAFSFDRSFSLTDQRRQMRNRQWSSQTHLRLTLLSRLCFRLCTA